MMLEAAIKPDARMRPFADFVKMAAFMLPTVSCVPYALDGNTLRPVTASKNHGDSFGRSLIGLVHGWTRQFEAQFPELFGIRRSRCVGHGFFGLLVLRKRNHLADRLLAGGEHHHAVEPVSEAAVRRSAVSEGVEQEAEATFGVLAGHTQPAEDPLLHFRVMDPYAARAKFGAIEDEVIGAGANPHRRTGPQGQILRPG